MAQTINKVTSRKVLKIVRSFTNGFAQQVYELEDGTMLFIDYHETKVEIVATKPLSNPFELVSLLNSLPEDN